MENALVIIVFFSFLLLVIGLISPKAGLFWTKKDQTRKRSTLIYGITMVGAFIMFGIVIEDDNKSEILENSPEDKIENAIELKNVESEERYLFNTVEDFRKEFNSKSELLDFNLHINKIRIETGEVNNSFTYKFSENIVLVGSLTKSNNKLKEVSMFGTGDGTPSSGANILTCMVNLIAAADAELPADDRGKILEDLKLINNDNTNILDLSTETVKNGIRYSLNSSELMGFIFSVSMEENK
jgi:hypothetical protein